MSVFRALKNCVTVSLLGGTAVLLGASNSFYRFLVKTIAPPSNAAHQFTPSNYCRWSGTSG